MTDNPTNDASVDADSIDRIRQRISELHTDARTIGAHGYIQDELSELETELENMTNHPETTESI